MNMLPDYQRYFAWLWVIMFAIVFQFLKQFKIKIIFLIFLIINVLNGMGSSPQSFSIFQLARAEALATRLTRRL